MSNKEQNNLGSYLCICSKVYRTFGNLMSDVCYVQSRWHASLQHQWCLYLEIVKQNKKVEVI